MPRSHALVSLLVLAGCADPAQRAADDALALQHAIPLPTVGAAGSAPPPPRLRVLVSRAGISVDDAALFASWPAPRRARLLSSLSPDDAAALPFVHRDLIHVAGDHIAPPEAPAPGTYDLRALHAVLDFARDVDRRYAQLEEAETGPSELAAYTPRALSVYAASDVPYALVLPVLYTAAQAEYNPMIVARGAQGDVDLGLRVPSPNDRASAARIVLARTGAFVTAEAGIARVRNAPRSTSSLGRPVTGPDRACTLPPASDGAPDRTRLRELLGALAKRMPEGAVAIVVPPPEMRWATVTAVADTAMEAGFPRFMLGIEQPADATPDCAAAVSVDEVRLDDLPRWH